ncbi:MAG: hypothetical protein ACP5D2_03870 [Candidatus Nanoarchaeia archaeon]
MKEWVDETHYNCCSYETLSRRSNGNGGCEWYEKYICEGGIYNEDKQIKETK